MPYEQGDIWFYASEGMLGGNIKDPLPDNSLNAVFPPLGRDELASGWVDYACIYVKNTTTNKTFTSVRIYIQSQPDSRQRKETISIGLDPQPGAPVQTIPNRNTAPQGVTFSKPSSYSTGLELGTFSPGDVRAVWIKRELPPNTEPNPDANFVLAVEGLLTT